MNSDVTSAPSNTTARPQAVILVLLIGAFVVILNETIMNVALPTLMSEFGVTASVVQWLATAFLLTMAVVIPITGYLLQRFTSRTVFFAAMGFFSLGTLLAALAPSFELLLLARIVQAVGTAITLPLLMTTVLTLVPPARRGVVMGNISIVISVAPALGPTLSGLILQTLSWRFMFLLVLPIALAVLTYGARTLVNVGHPRRLTLDLPSVPLAAVGFGGGVYALSRLGEARASFTDAQVLWPLALSAVSLALFVARQLMLQRRDAPLLDLRTLRYPMFTLGLVLLMLAMTALFGGAILLPLYLQAVVGLSTLQTGLLLLPGGVLMGVLAPIVGRLYDRFGPAWLTTPGAVLLTLALWRFAQLTVDTSVPVLLTLHLTLSVGLALLFTPLFTSGLSPLPARLYSHGSALLSTLQQVAGAAGTALLVTVMTGRVTRAVADGTALPVAQAEGVRAAFGLAAGLAVLMVLLAPFTRRTSPRNDASSDEEPTVTSTGH
ncbi:DHA2 family efflux MFS transporter permease subunit [Deinococcus yavapaiensis]|uniref:DHA2 family lincomycin resistance protein-like MFS transporter n=1 Tax=Deinococcus yavapaiensis KR-236 TaxID=694435 RepID=A0A318SGN8_9DEIO|nr:DHA2 family efflux MFS transporter permease subunit [Deinococcus yavapaiensis]PYE49434.1 DHA2 family lincomycin resistance protein-like MFS transporter [Deinococcus yavapaiensis KR-236]